MRYYLLACLLALFARSLPLSAVEPRWAQMDYGPTLGCSLLIGKEYVLRALIVRLDQEKQTYVAYDLETMRIAAMWTGGFIDGNGVVFNGKHHEQPQPLGTLLFNNSVGPGWAKDGNFLDPRPEYKAAYNVPKGGSELTREGQPMPKGWARYLGHYLHGQDVVIACDVDGVLVLEHPRLIANTVIREITIAASEREQRVYLAGTGMECGIFGDVPGIALRNHNDLSDPHVEVVIAPGETRTLQAYIGAKVEAGPARNVLDLTRGGKPRWQETLTTTGNLASGNSAYVVDTITAPDDNPWKSWLRFAGFDFFPESNRAAICTWSGDVWIVSGLTDDLKTLTWKRFATGLHEPLGLIIESGHRERILVNCRNGIMRLHDLDQDGEADYIEAFNTEVHLTRHFHEFSLDLQRDVAGNLYFAKGCTPGRGGPNFDLWSRHNGCFFKLSPDGKQLDVVTRGLRAPNGIGIGPHGEMTSGDNQGSWVPACPINRIRQDGFVGVPDGVPGDRKPSKRDPPICWLPMDVDNSSGCQVWVPDQRWGPFAGRMLHLSYGKASLFSVMTQDIGEVQQGAVYKFPLTFASGMMRARFSPSDGQLYVCGLRGWQTNGVRDGAFQRARYTGSAVTMPSAWAVTKTGIALTFTTPLDRAIAEDPNNYSGQQYNLIWSATYGSPEFSVSDPQKKGRDTVVINVASLLADGRTVTLTIADLKPVHCQSITYKIATAEGQKLHATIWSTIHTLPTADAPERP